MAWTRKSGQTDLAVFNASTQNPSGTLLQSVVVGDAICVGLKYDNAASGTAADNHTVTDNLGNTYSKVVTAFIVDECRITLFLATVTTGGSCTITGHTASAASAMTLFAMEYVPPTSVGGSDGTPTSNKATGTAISSGNITTTVADDLLFAMAGDTFNGTPYTAGSSFTKRGESNSSNGRCAFFDRIVTATGTYGASATASNSVSWVCAIMAVKDSAGGGGSTGFDHDGWQPPIYNIDPIVSVWA